MDTYNETVTTKETMEMMMVKSMLVTEAWMT